ncbi:phospholipid-binding lipoprotein mlaA [Enterobacter asburiae]|uniref:Phospholipid-binding lipoprotein mlaA n=1 Tax=Enterobacter asburiae TaxID=61645 RepID=A0A376FLQ2_ENTAS|nr:phospholipid-binding lipoprotein mlaA [Enterobacter asburiae]
MKLRLSALALGATMLVGCASSGEQTGRSDPLEGFNRSMYSFNYKRTGPVCGSSGGSSMARLCSTTCA